MKDAEFKHLLEEARRVEIEILKHYRQNIDPKARLAPPRTKEYDLYCPKVNHVEIKHDKAASFTDHYVFEFEDALGNPSGIKATKAGEFVIVDRDQVVFLKTSALAFLLKESKKKRVIKMGYQTKEGKRSWGWLVPRSEIILSPYAEVLKRWFK